jgi:2-methylcitrate dehydratase PrpD
MPEGGRAGPAVSASEEVARFIHALRFDALPASVVRQASRCLLDTLGVAAAGSTTRLSAIAREHATRHLRGRDGEARMLFDGRQASAAGAAFAGASTIDAFDAHDGHVLTKGHAGVAVVPTLLAFADLATVGVVSEAAARNPAEQTSFRGVDGRELLTSLVVGYEIATRAGIALHGSVTDYHCSGAWNALGAAAAAARALGLDVARTREALGVAEYHGTRGQMMRTCRNPSMVKDGSGWGAHTGVSAAWLARDGFTGAPAVTIEEAADAELWRDLGTRWRILEQYFKAYPVCRWAQPAIEATLTLRRLHRFECNAVAHVTIATFAEAVALGAARRHPGSTEDAQYSLAYPVAAALVFGRVGAREIDVPALHDARVARLIDATSLDDCDEFSRRFPAERLARVTLRLRDGRALVSQTAVARGGAENPLSDEELREKYIALASPVLGAARAARIESAVHDLVQGGPLDTLLDATLASATHGASPASDGDVRPSASTPVV